MTITCSKNSVHRVIQGLIVIIITGSYYRAVTMKISVLLIAFTVPSYRRILFADALVLEDRWKIADALSKRTCTAPHRKQMNEFERCSHYLRR